MSFDLLFSAPLGGVLPVGFEPVGALADTPPVADGGVPQRMADLGELLSYTYDLTARRAGELSIPVAGSVQGGADRRVIVYEWTRYKAHTDSSGVELRYGFVVRFCLTINKVDATAKLSLPFLSAQAQMGQIEAAWMMQVRGLTGPKINAVVLPPQELSVETFVLAKQSLEKVISAIDDASTKFVPGILLARVDPATPATLYWLGAVRAYAFYCVTKNRSRTEAIVRLGASDPGVADTISEAYQYLGLSDPTTTPPETAKTQARSILRNIKADT